MMADIQWLGSRGATRRELRKALAFWVQRAERFEQALAAEDKYLAARGVVSNGYALGKAVAEVEASRDW